MGHHNQKTGRMVWAALAIVLSVFVSRVHAGGPAWVDENGSPYVWATSTPIQITLDSDTPLAVRDAVVAAFKKWSDASGLPIAIIDPPTVLLTPDGDVDSVGEYSAVKSCEEAKTPLIYDTGGTILAALGKPSGTIGGASVCLPASGTTITKGYVLLNGKYFDGDLTNGESDINVVLIHEFGHLVGLGHSQVNGQLWFDADPSSFSSDYASYFNPTTGQPLPQYAEYVEIMFPWDGVTVKPRVVVYPFSE